MFFAFLQNRKNEYKAERLNLRISSENQKYYKEAFYPIKEKVS